MKILFAPDHTPELELVKQMLRATDRLDFAIFTFAGSSAIDDAMVVLRRAGVRVRGALDPKHTAPANEYNDENLFVLGSPSPNLPRKEGGPVDQTACGELCAFFRTEIGRIIASGVRFRS